MCERPVPGQLKATDSARRARRGRPTPDHKRPQEYPVAAAVTSSADEGAPGPREAPDRMQEAMDVAAAITEKTNGLGHPGRPLNKRSPFFVGMAAAAGVAVTYGLVEIVIRARSVLVLIGLALFIAAGLDPAVSWLTRRGLRRPVAVIVILLAVLAVVAG